MPKRKRQTAVEQLIGELAAEYERLPTEEAREKLKSGDVLVASRKELRAKRQQRDVTASHPSGRIRAAR